MRYPLFSSLFIEPLFKPRHTGVSIITCSYASPLRTNLDNIVKQIAVSSTLLPSCFVPIPPDITSPASCCTRHTLALPLLSRRCCALQRNAVHAPLAQVVDMQLAVSGVGDVPPMYCIVKDIHARLTTDSSSRQQLERLKPRLGAHLLCCEHSGTPGTAVHWCVRWHLHLSTHDSLFGFL